MTATNRDSLGERLLAVWSALVALCSQLSGRAVRRLKRPLLIVVGSVIILMLLIVVLQSGLGVDSDETITDSHRPEIVGGE